MSTNPATTHPATDGPVPASHVDEDLDGRQPDRISSSDQYLLRFLGPGGQFILDRQERALRHLLAATGSSFMDVLDVGGGHLQVAPLLARFGHRVVVHASAPDCMPRFEALRRQHPDSVSARIGPFERLPAADGEFDLVISLRIIGHVADWRGLLGEMCRVSRRWVAIEFASSDGVQRLARPLFALKRRVEGDTRRFHTYPVSQIIDELARHGCRATAIERQFVLPIVLHRALQRPALSASAEGALARLGLAERLGSPVILLAERSDRAGSRA